MINESIQETNLKKDSLIYNSKIVYFEIFKTLSNNNIKAIGGVSTIN